MTFRHLEIFMSVYQNQSITKASKELHISQPSVSLAIKELEEKYQTPLFDRMNRQIYPTKKAHLLYNHSLQILSSLENMENEMYEDHVENISFGCSVTMAQVFLPQLLKKLTTNNNKRNYNNTYNLFLLFTPPNFTILVIRFLESL